MMTKWVGTLDLISDVTHGIKNTAADSENELDRQRLPRFIGRDGILKVLGVLSSNFS